MGAGEGVGVGVGIVVGVGIGSGEGVVGGVFEGVCVFAVSVGEQPVTTSINKRRKVPVITIFLFIINSEFSS
ncbi:hypothetical protein ACFLWZ_02980 [Chloroflexota bacterium]